MNIRKTGEWNVKEGTIEIKPMWITKGWRRITGYQTRGYRNRVKLIGRSRMYIDNAELTKYFKKNRVHQLVNRSYAKREWIRIR
jgi:hypothetical protein